MPGRIFLIQNDDSLVALREEPYANEDLLQTLLARYPDLLAGEQMDGANPRRWLLVGRELSVPGDEDGPRGLSLDHLFLDQDGIPTLVEVKRSSDTRIRREVVGQMLDYAANGALHWTVEALRAAFEAGCESRGESAEGLLALLLNSDPDGDTIETYWQRVKTNLQAGRVRLVFVADEVPAGLRRIVEFLNGQMDPAEVLAVEMRSYVGEGIKTIVPRVYGLTTDSERRKGAGTVSNKWDEASFFGALAEAQPAAVGVARQILQWATQRASYVWWGEGVSRGSFVPILVHEETKHQLFAVWTNGYIEFYFQWYQRKPPFDDRALRLELLQRLNGIAGINLGEDALRKRPSIALATIGDEAALQELLGVFDWVIGEIERV